jgi:hypothetical protein
VEVHLVCLIASELLADEDELSEDEDKEDDDEDDEFSFTIKWSKSVVIFSIIFSLSS